MRPAHPLAGARVLVVGASGFLGSRLVERLATECGANVRVLVRRVMSAAVISRFPIEIEVGDIVNAADVSRATRGCLVVFNCVKGKGGDAAARRAADVDGARVVVEAAAAAGARVVHVSTMAVYERPFDGTFDEQSPDARPGDTYTDNKRAGERVALETGARLAVPVTVVQPSVVYGPNAGVYGREILEEMQENRLLLIDGGRGICNAVFVDDVVTALLLAGVTDATAGHRFLISGPEHPTWREFFGGFEKMLGASRTVSMAEAEALALWKRTRRSRWLLPECLRIAREDPVLRRRLLSTREGALVRRAARRVLTSDLTERLRTPPQRGDQNRVPEELPIAAVRPWVVHNMARRARVRIDKARTVLGYAPAYTLDVGMRLTADWARWAGLTPGSDTA